MPTERIQSVNSDRIVWCCNDRGITPDELAITVHIPESTMQRLFAGEDALTFNQLKKVAEFFGRGVLFFLDPNPVDAASVHTAQFRTIANQKADLSPKVKNIIERVEKQRDVYLNLRQSSRSLDAHPAFDPPDMTGIDIAVAASRTRAWLSLAIQTSFDSYREALERKGILVFRSNGYTGKWQIPKDDPILGFNLYDENCPVIFVKKQYPSQQSFTLMHELGHVLLHRTSSIDDAGDLEAHAGRERDANAFAGHVLVPTDFLRSIRDRERPRLVQDFDDWLSTQRRAWGVSAEVILRRLHDVGRLTRDQYQAYRRWREGVPRQDDERGNRKYRYREPKHVFGDPFVLTVLEALNSQKVTLNKASTYLDGLKIQDLHRLENFYAGL
jgi:Zn-dependent peptidase ImmA (M78 family)